MDFFNSDKEKAALVKFRERIAHLLPKMNDEQKQDYNLVRWLRARELNIEKSEEMLRKHLEWREKHDVDNIWSWIPPQDFIDAMPYKIAGRDKAGRYIFVCPTGSWDVRSLCEKGYKKTLLKSTIKFLELISGFARIPLTEGGPPVGQYIMVNDMEGYSMRQLLSSDVRESNVEMMKIFEMNYPELLAKGIVINAPKVFAIFFNLIKPLLSAYTLSKVQIFDSNPEHWKPALLDNTHPDQLLSTLGGANLTCPNYNLEKRYVLPDQPPEYSESLLQTVSVPAGSDYRVDIDVDVVGTTLSWNFKTESYDIGFKFLFKDKELHSCPRADAHKFTQKGIHVCEEVGQYTLLFDNKHSKMRSKSLSYYHHSTTNPNNNKD